MVVTPPAAAEVCGLWSNGMAMRDSSCNRDTFILDPGRGTMLTRQAILQHRDYYESWEFSLNFLWYAPEGNRVFQADNHETWSSCTDDMPDDQTCTPGGEVWPFHRVINAFSERPVVLPSLTFENGFIALTCGNFSAGVAAKPVPVISGYKFHDRDRDGVRDPGEPGLAGWTMTLRRDRSDDGQTLGPVTTDVTDANGYYEFPLDGHYPGDYAVTEEDRTDWTRTTSPARHTIRVSPGVANHNFTGNDFGNVETKADAVKVSFAVVDPPAEMRADAETTLRVRAVLENRGPAPIVDVSDAITASGPADCTFRPAQQAVTRRLILGQPVEVVFEVGVTCTEPSFHPLDFANALTVVTPGVTDPDQSSNQRTAAATIAVIDESDVKIDDTVLDCVDRTYVDEQFACTVTATVSNGGDHSPAVADVLLGLTGPADCVLAPIGATHHEDERVAADTQTVVATTWDVVCGDRSYHDFAATSQVVLDHLHVVDPDASNNDGAATDRVEVFELVDLSISDLRITCSEREYRMQDITCVSTVTVANAGPATGVATRTEVGFTAPADCTVSPTRTQEDSRTVDAGTSATFTKTWQLSCNPARRHTFTTCSTIAAAEPHPEDVNRDNDTDCIDWQPIDVKPRSFPSSVNVKKEGAVPVAVLSTLEFDAVTQVDKRTLTFGATGTEDSWIRCADVGEDVNGDGLADLICQFDTQRTGLTCDSITATLMGYTVDGRRFEGQDDVKITGC